MSQSKQRVSAFLSLKAIMAAVILVPTVVCCVSYVEVGHVIKGQQNLVYQINTTGETTQFSIFKPGDLVRELDKKAAGTIIIKSFQLESMDIEVEPNAANTAQIFQLQSLVAKELKLTSAGREFLNRQDKPIPVGKAGAFIANAYFFKEGVDDVNKLIGDAMVGRRPQDISTLIQFDLKGRPMPINSRVSVKLTVNLNVTIEYTRCEQVVDLFFEGSSDEC